MIDYSALPSCKHTPSVLSNFGIALVAVIGPVLLLSVGLLTQGIISIIGLVAGTGLFIGVTGVIGWKYMTRAIWPRLRLAILGVPIESIVDQSFMTSLRRFADDNHFQLIEYPPETEAPEDYYIPLADTSLIVNVFLLYEMKGVYDGMSFTYCCLGVEWSGDGRKHPGPGGYAYSSRMLQMTYENVIMLDQPIKTWHKGAWYAINAPSGYVHDEGHATDREAIRRLFEAVKREDTTRHEN